MPSSLSNPDETRPNIASTTLILNPSCIKLHNIILTPISNFLSDHNGANPIFHENLQCDKKTYLRDRHRPKRKHKSGRHQLR